MSSDRQAKQLATRLASLSGPATAVAVISSAALEWVRASESSAPASLVVISLGMAAGACLLRQVLARLAPSGGDPHRRSGLAFLGLVLFGILPFLTERIGRSFGSGESPEFVQLVVLRNLIWGLIAIAASERLLQAASALSLFLMLGVVTFLTGWAAYIAVVVYALGGLWLLLASQWRGLEGRFPVHSRREFPLRVGLSAIGVGVASVLLAAVCLSGGTSLRVLEGWAWGSGGSGEGDPFAARGVGDGPNLVSGTTSADSIGAVESDLFLDSNAPSLYDVFNDTFGEPVRKGETERAVALAPEKLLTNAAQVSAGAAGKGFAAVRKSPGGKKSPPPKLPENLLLTLGGRVPRHLRLETFERFDGREWTNLATPANHPPLVMQAEQLRSWAVIDRPLRAPTDAPAEVPVEAQVLKVHRLRTARIPTPNHPLSLHVQHVDRSDFFAWTSDEVFAFTGRETVPAQLVLHLRSQIHDPQRLKILPASEPPALPPLAEDESAIRELALGWTRGVPSGWPQVQAIVDRLREGYRLDRQRTAPEQSRNVAAEFLFRAKAGPEYQFATAAAALLQSLGYRCRLATGLYARPENQDWRGRETSVYRDDAHVWLEVFAQDGVWLTVEPSPGYEATPPLRTWAESLASACRQGGAWAANHPLVCLSLFALALLCWRHRLWFVDLLLTSGWRWSSRGTARRRALSTLWLLEQRLRWAGAPRPPGATLSRWLRTLPLAEPSENRKLLEEFLELANWALYCERESPHRDAATAQICQAVARAWPLPRLEHSLRGREARHTTAGRTIGSLWTRWKTAS